MAWFLKTPPRLIEPAIHGRFLLISDAKLLSIKVRVLWFLQQYAAEHDVLSVGQIDVELKSVIATVDSLTLVLSTGIAGGC